MFSKQGFEVYKLFRAQLQWENDMLKIRKAKHWLEYWRLHWSSLESRFYLFTRRTTEWTVSHAAFDWGGIFLLLPGIRGGISFIKSPIQTHGLAASASTPLCQKDCSHPSLFLCSSLPSPVTGIFFYTAQGALHCVTTRDVAFHSWLLSSNLKTNNRKKERKRTSKKRKNSLENKCK